MARAVEGIAIAAFVILVTGLPVMAQDDGAGDADANQRSGSDPPQTPGIEEFIVTSSGQTQALQDASVSVSSFDQEYLEALGAQTIIDVAQFTPNLEIRSPYSNTNPTLFIRGVGLRDFNANSSSSVAVFSDDVYMNSPVGQLSQLFDVEDVQVLRGPQGVLSGRNASAGAIRVLSRRPTGTFNGYTRGTYGRFNQAEIEGALELPLWGDMLSIRSAGVWNHRDPFVNNRCGDQAYANPDRADPFGFVNRVHQQCFTGLTQPNGRLGTTDPVSQGGNGWVVGQKGFVPDKVNDTSNWAARTILRFQPTRNHDFTLKLGYSQNRAQARQLQHLSVSETAGIFQFGGDDSGGYLDHDNTTCFRQGSNRGCVSSPTTGSSNLSNITINGPELGDPYAGDYNYVGDDFVDRAGATLRGDIYMGAFTLETVTSLDWNERDSGVDIDGSPNIGVETELYNTAWQFYEDIRLLWDDGKSFTWEVGGAAMFEKLFVDNIFLLNGGFALSRITQRYTQKTIYWSTYAHGAWAVSEEFNISGGARWNYDSRDFSIIALRGPADLSGFSRIDGTADFAEEDWAGELSLEYKPLEDVTFYGKYSRGWKGPHINGLVFDDEILESGEDPLEPVKPETVNVLEAGFKTQWLDRRLQFNGAGFYYDYDDIQIFQLRNADSGIPVPTLINSNDAELYGVEIEVTARPLEGWAPLGVEGLAVFGSFSWLQGQYKDFSVTRRVGELAGAPAITEDFSGNQLINSPEFSFTGYAAWQFDLDGMGFITPRFDWSFKDRVFFNVDNREHLSQPPLWLFNIRLAYQTPNELVEVAGYVRNLTDEVYRADVINLSRFRGAVLYAIGDPRVYGVSVNLRW